MKLNWEFVTVTNYNLNGEVSRVRECRKILAMKFPDDLILKMYLNGSVAYAAMKGKDDLVRAVVVCTTMLRERDKPKQRKLGYYVVPESDGPDRVDCTDAVLNLLSKTEDEESLRWRAACREENEAKRKAAILNNLPVGAKILAIWNEEEIELTKSMVFQYKKPIWYDGHYQYNACKLAKNGFTVLN